MNNFKKNAIRNVLIMTVLAAPITVHAQEAEDVAALVATQSVAETAYETVSAKPQSAPAQEAPAKAVAPEEIEEADTKPAEEKAPAAEAKEADANDERLAAALAKDPADRTQEEKDALLKAEALQPEKLEIAPVEVDPSTLAEEVTRDAKDITNELINPVVKIRETETKDTEGTLDVAGGEALSFEFPLSLRRTPGTETP